VLHPNYEHHKQKGEAGTGNVVEAVRHARAISKEIEEAKQMNQVQLTALAGKLRVSLELLTQTVNLGRLPVVNFAAGGLATPADVSLLMQLGVDGVFVGSGIFKSSNPDKRARAMVMATTHYNDPKILAEVSEDLGEPMVGIDLTTTEKWALRESIPKDSNGEHK